MKNIIGQRFGTLVAITNSYKKKREGCKNESYYVLLKCDCGEEKETSLRSIMCGNTKSCGRTACRPKIDPSINQKGSYAVNGRKKCSKCLAEKTTNDFHNHKSRPDGFTSWCKRCYQVHDYGIKFKLTPDQIDYVLNNQHNCDICQKEISALNGKELQIDHDHFSGKIRGILCTTCNLALRETISEQVVQAAIDYVSMNGDIDLSKTADKQSYFYFSKMDYNKRKFKYGCDRETFNKLLNFSNGCCHICKKKLQKKRDVCVDHCHKSFKVRGILCQDCNSFIGYMADDLNKMKSAMRFLQCRSMCHPLLQCPQDT